jgi:hypothetical protein
MQDWATRLLTNEVSQKSIVNQRIMCRLLVKDDVTAPIKRNTERCRYSYENPLERTEQQLITG